MIQPRRCLARGGRAGADPTRRLRFVALANLPAYPPGVCFLHATTVAVIGADIAHARRYPLASRGFLSPGWCRRPPLVDLSTSRRCWAQRATQPS